MSGLRRDVSLPGARLDLRIVYVGSASSSEQVAGEIRLETRRADSNEDFRRIELRRGSRLFCYGLRPGRYELEHAGPYRFLAGFAKPGSTSATLYRFRVPEGTAVHEVELAVHHQRD